MIGRFHIHTFGCQMNHHDSEKMSNLLLHCGYVPARTAGDAQIVLVHTCSVRERAEHKLYSELGLILLRKTTEPELIVGVGGCVAQQEGAELMRRFPALDFVFGPQNIVHLPEMVEAARCSERRVLVDYDADRDARFDFPDRHPAYASTTPGRAFVTVMEGCDLFCTYCVVPRTRGREASRPSASILAEVERLAACGVVEVTLLGQTVNAYGRPRPGMRDGEIPFSELIRKVASVAGIERIRFTSPHPIFFTPDLIALYGELPELCPHVHIPVQSGSTRILEAMNRRYTRDEFLARIQRLRDVRPDLAITTDFIVGFPGESDEDFEQTLRLMAEVGFADSFSFKYSERPGTPAQRRGLAPIAPALAQERLERLQALQAAHTMEAHQRRVGTRTSVLVTGTSRHGGDQVQGRCPYHRVVNFRASEIIEAGRIVDVRIAAATPHSLVGVPLGAGGESVSLELPLLASRPA